MKNYFKKFTGLVASAVLVIGLAACSAESESNNAAYLGVLSSSASKSQAVKETVETPVFSVEAGEVESGTSVTISCATEGASIYYTTDGNAPTTASTEYSKAISITEACTIKAIAVKNGMNDSEVASAEYTIASDGTEVEIKPQISYDDSKSVYENLTTINSLIEFDYKIKNSDSDSYDTYKSFFTYTSDKTFTLKSGYLNDEIIDTLFMELDDKTLKSGVSDDVRIEWYMDKNYYRWFKYVSSTYENEDFMNTGVDGFTLKIDSVTVLEYSSADSIVSIECPATYSTNSEITKYFNEQLTAENFANSIVTKSGISVIQIDEDNIKCHVLPGRIFILNKGDYFSFAGGTFYYFEFSANGSTEQYGVHDTSYGSYSPYIRLSK